VRIVGHGAAFPSGPGAGRVLLLPAAALLLGLAFPFTVPVVEGVIAPGGAGVVIAAAGEPDGKAAGSHEERHRDCGDEGRVDHAPSVAPAGRAVTPGARAPLTFGRRQRYL